MTQANKLYSVLIGFVLHGLKPITVVQSNLVVAEYREGACDQNDGHKDGQRYNAAYDY